MMFRFGPIDFARLDNTLVAGRGLSATHEALVAVRVMTISMAVGQAAGTAAAMAAGERTPSESGCGRGSGRRVGGIDGQAADVEPLSAEQFAALSSTRQLAFCSEAGFSPAIRCEASTVFGVLRMVAAGVGLAIVPSSVASAADERIVLRRLVRPARPGALLVVRRRVDRDPAVADFCALMGSAFAELRRLVERRWREG